MKKKTLKKAFKNAIILIFVIIIFIIRYATGLSTPDDEFCPKLSAEKATIPIVTQSPVVAKRYLPPTGHPDPAKFPLPPTVVFNKGKYF